VPVNTWRNAAKEVLKSAGISQAQVAASQLNVNRAAFSPYLSGGRKHPRPRKVLEINCAIAAAVNDPSVEAYLDCEAVESGVLPRTFLAQDAVIDGAFLALGELATGYLVADWEQRLSSAVGAWDDEKAIRFLLVLNRDYRRLLRRHKKVPWKEGLSAISTVLGTFGLGKVLVSKRTAGYDRLEKFREIVRRELDDALDAGISARERQGVENRIYIAALGLLGKGPPSSLVEALLGFTPKQPSEPRAGKRSK
jgi:hypothetical protein